jgi:hypothetical protein
MTLPAAETTSLVLREAWTAYHATLEEMRVLTESTPRFQQNPQHRAKAYHTLMEMQAMAYNFAVAPRLLHPRIYLQSSWQTDLYTLGQNCQDFLYGLFFVDGQQRYRLSGRMGDISLFLLQTHNGLFGEEGVNITGNYDWADFQIEADGCFEVILSAEPEPGNWIKLDPQAGYQFMFIRRVLADWQGDAGELHLQRISEIPDTHYDADEFDEAAMAVRIRRAAAFVRYLVECFNVGLYNFYFGNAVNQKNVLTLLPGIAVSQVGSPTSNYAMAVFELGEDEALLIEMDKVPDGVYWSFQLGDVWSRSLDYSNRQSSLNLREIAVDHDGSFRVVVAHRDPGINNWLDTCGRIEGTVVFRNYRASSAPVPVSRKLKFAELASFLPEGTVRVTPSMRIQALARRRLGQRRLYGE